MKPLSVLTAAVFCFLFGPTVADSMAAEKAGKEYQLGARQVGVARGPTGVGLAKMHLVAQPGRGSGGLAARQRFGVGVQQPCLHITVPRMGRECSQ